jgi:hypothetical protein
MLLIIFGAGASYDSVPAYRPPDKVTEQNFLIEQHRLPLANGLFENRSWFAKILEQYPQCHPVVPLLREPEGGSIEKVLQQLRSEGSPRRLRQLAAVRCYLRHVLGACGDSWHATASGITNYVTLLDEIEHRRAADEKVCIVTFNYDRMIDLALSTVGVTITNLKDYVGHPAYKLIKIHGSVNWMRRIETTLTSLYLGAPPLIREEIINRAAELKIGGEFQMPNIDYSIMSSANTDAWFPALAIPVERKTEFECPPEHLKVFRELIPDVERVLIVGWRATELSFLELLKMELRQQVRGVVVNGNAEEGQSTIDRLTDAGIDGKFRIVNGGFSDFVVDRQFGKWLS